MIISVLVSLLLPALWRAKEKARDALCKGNLRQIGIALSMYVTDHNYYPPLGDWDTLQIWPDRLCPYNPVKWTNAAWNCPTYVANRGMAIFWATNTVVRQAGARLWTSYGYNNNGVIGNGWGQPVVGLRHDLGLGGQPAFSPREPEVLQPSEMYAVADARSFHHGSEGWFPIEPPNAALGCYTMTAWRDPWHWDNSLHSLREMSPPHGGGYNILFCDGHVMHEKRRDLFYPPRTAHHWNRDNKPHEEAWAPPNWWEFQQ